MRFGVGGGNGLSELTTLGEVGEKRSLLPSDGFLCPLAWLGVSMVIDLMNVT